MDRVPVRTGQRCRMDWVLGRLGGDAWWTVAGCREDWQGCQMDHLEVLGAIRKEFTVSITDCQ